MDLIAIGTTARLSLSTLTASFFVGAAMSTLSLATDASCAPWWRPPSDPCCCSALVLAGAHLDFRVSPALPWIAGAAVGARVVAKLVLGWFLAGVSKPAHKAGPLVGLSLLSCGALAISIGLAFALRFPGKVGDSVLVVAAVTATFGEFVGPVRLRRALQVTGEIDALPDAAGPRLAA